MSRMLRLPSLAELEALKARGKIREHKLETDYDADKRLGEPVGKPGRKPKGKAAAGKERGSESAASRAGQSLSARRGSGPETLLALQIASAGLPAPEREVRLIPDRKFRWDFVWRSKKLVLEVQGAVYVTGAHSTGQGIERDCEKGALAAIAGYRSVSVSAGQVRSGQALEWLRKALETP